MQYCISTGIKGKVIAEDYFTTTSYIKIMYNEALKQKLSVTSTRL